VLTCAIHRWLLNIGDPGWAGWGIVALYVLASGLSLRAGLSSGRRDERAFWLVAAGLLSLYAANKELDLQTLLTGFGRCLSRAEGWHDRRRVIQLAVTLVLGGAFAGAVAFAALRLRGLMARTGIAAAGLVLVCGYAVGRAVIINHVDGLFGLDLEALKLSWLMEVPGALLVIAGASVDRIRQAARTAPHRRI
jgi:hypothetical protein